MENNEYIAKDWGGNSKSTYSQLGANNHSSHEREKHDYYATDSIAIDRLVKVFELPDNLYECSAGEGNLSHRLKELGYNVLATDLIDRGTPDIKGGIDYLNVKSLPKGYNVLTNPPYTLSQKFILHTLELLEEGKQGIFFLKLQFLETQRRYKELFSKYPPKYVYVATQRIVCAMNGKFVDDNGKKASSAVAYAWYVWEKGYKGEPIIRWF